MGSLITSKRNRGSGFGEKGHRVLLFGQELFDGCQGELRDHPNAEIVPLKFPDDYSKLKRLADYTLGIADYAAFSRGVGGPLDAQGVFEKMMIEALTAGTCFCFVYFDEEIPEFDQYGYKTAHMNKADMKRLAKIQIGYRWLNYLQIKPLHSDSVLLFGDVKRQEFKKFFIGWGGGHHAFRPYGDRQFDEVLIASDEDALGFALNVRRSKIIYLPFQRDFQRSQDFADGMFCLIDSTLSYLAKSSAMLPTWANQPFFPGEKEIQDQCKNLERQIAEQREKLLPFEEAKALLFQSEYSLEAGIPDFFSKRLGLSVERNERYQEDFWILDEKGEKAVMVEVKSAVKGFKKSQIFAAFNHREETNSPMISLFS